MSAAPDLPTPCGVPVRAAGACPGCGASARPGAPWCTQCFADLSPAPVQHAVQHAVGVPVRAGGRQAGAPCAGPSWPCTSCGAGNGYDAGACAACGAGFLAAAHAAAGPPVLPVVRDLTRLRRWQRLALAGAAALALVLLTALLGVASLLLTG